MASYAFDKENPESDFRSRLAERGLGRTKAVGLTWLATVVGCLIVLAISVAAGVNYGLADDEVWSSLGIGVPFIVTVTLLPGMILAAVLSLKWPRMLDIAIVAGPVLALLTIILSFLPDLSLGSSISFGLMHVVAAPIMFVGLNLIKRRDEWSRR
ncbi:MAG: DUF6069 family protein [Thermomicrobiales bacterium]